MCLHSADCLQCQASAWLNTRPKLGQYPQSHCQGHPKEGNQEQTLPERFNWGMLALGPREVGNQEEPRGSSKCRKHLTALISDVLRLFLAGKLACLNP